MRLLQKIRSKAIVLESKLRPKKYVPVELSSQSKTSRVLLKRGKLIGRGDFENEVYSIDVVKGKHVLRMVEKIFGHSDPKAVRYDAKILRDLKKAGCRVPTTIRIRENGFPSLVMTDLRFVGKGKQVLDLGHKMNLSNAEEVKNSILQQVKLAAEIGYELRQDAFMIVLDKRGVGIPFIVDVDFVEGPSKINVENVLEKWKTDYFKKYLK